MNGFEVPTMSLDISQSPPLRFTWNAPATTEFVACGVFTCNPVMGRRTEAPQRIANANGCILDFQVVDAAGSWLTMPTVLRSPYTARCTNSSRFDRIIEFTAVGCWAYSSHAIVAASELHGIAPTFLTGEGSKSTSEIPSDASCEVDDEPCYDAEHEFFGACIGGRCVPRCTSAADCELAAKRFFGMSSSSCDWECRPIPDSPAGVCVQG